MALAPYTTNDEVRATVGVSDEEIPDATLDLALYARALEYELTQLGSSLISDFTTAAAAGSPTANQTALVSAVKLFAPFAVGNQLAAALPLMAPKMISDGKASFSRFAESPFQLTAEKVRQDFEKFKKNLSDVYATFLGSGATASFTPRFMLVGDGAVDRVTGV